MGEGSLASLLIAESGFTMLGKAGVFRGPYPHWLARRSCPLCNVHRSLPAAGSRTAGRLDNPNLQRHR